MNNKTKLSTNQTAANIRYIISTITYQYTSKIIVLKLVWLRYFRCASFIHCCQFSIRSKCISNCSNQRFMYVCLSVSLCLSLSLSVSVSLPLDYVRTGRGLVEVLPPIFFSKYYREITAEFQMEPEETYCVPK